MLEETNTTTSVNDAKQGGTGLSVDNLAAIIAAIKGGSNPVGVAKAHLQYKRVWCSIQPNLKADGSKFAEWLEAVHLKVVLLFCLPNYFIMD